MTNAVLDEILQQLNDVHGVNNPVAGDKFLNSIKSDPDIDDARFLKNKGYVTIEYPNAAGRNFDTPYWYIGLTPLGAKYIMDGGFTREAFLKEEPIRISKQANEISGESLEVAKDSLRKAKLAIWISVGALIITVIIYLLQTYYPPKK